MPDITYNEDRLRELMLYVADESRDDPKFGATKLNKILFFSDFLAYAELGAPITGAVYQRLPNGPAARRLLPVQQDLQASGDAEVEVVDRYGFQQKRLVPRRKPKIELFDTSELHLVDEVIAACRDLSAISVSDLSHRLSMGWQIARNREDIPYPSVFLSADEPSEADIQRGQSLAMEHEWMAAT